MTKLLAAALVAACVGLVSCSDERPGIAVLSLYESCDGGDEDETCEAGLDCRVTATGEMCTKDCTASVDASEPDPTGSCQVAAPCHNGCCHITSTTGGGTLWFGDGMCVPYPP